MRLGLMVFGVGVCLGLPAIGQEQSKDEPQRQLGAHAHGQGKLSIAIERRTVEMELEAPGSDIVGFEHSATSAEQKAAVAKARAALAKPLALFKVPDAAGCKVTSSKVKVVGGGGHDHDRQGSHGHAAKGKEVLATHSEFHAEYVLSCAKPDMLQTIEFEYFKSFTGAEALDVTMIGPKGQSKHTVTREKSRLDLKGTS